MVLQNSSPFVSLLVLDTLSRPVDYLQIASRRLLER